MAFQGDIFRFRPWLSISVEVTADKLIERYKNQNKLGSLQQIMSSQSLECKVDSSQEAMNLEKQNFPDINTSVELISSPSKDLTHQKQTAEKFHCLSIEKLLEYDVGENIQKHKCISQKIRNKLRCWMSQIACGYGLSKKIAALACFLLDYYFSKGFKCQPSEYPLLGFACLIIPSKFEANTHLKPFFVAEEHARAIELELEVLMKLTFLINPQTYWDYGHALIQLWKMFCQKLAKKDSQEQLDSQKQISGELKEKCLALKFSFNLFAELMESALNVLESLKKRLDHLVFNAFYLILVVQIYGIKSDMDPSQFLKSLPQKEKIDHLMEQFGSFCSSQGYEMLSSVNEDMVSYLGSLYTFLIKGLHSNLLNPESQEEFDPNHIRWNYQELRDNQTFFFANKESSALAFIDYKKTQSFNLPPAQVVSKKIPSSTGNIMEPQ